MTRGLWSIKAGECRVPSAVVPTAPEVTAEPDSRRVSPRKKAKTGPDPGNLLLTGNSKSVDATGTYGGEVIGKACRVYWCAPDFVLATLMQIVTIEADQKQKDWQDRSVVARRPRMEGISVVWALWGHSTLWWLA
jgi:hypothetical protein